MKQQLPQLMLLMKSFDEAVSRGYAVARFDIPIEDIIAIRSELREFIQRAGVFQVPIIGKDKYNGN